ncbi:MAG: hypothetical protein ACFE0P_09815 [Oceanicaulis sp.]
MVIVLHAYELNLVRFPVIAGADFVADLIAGVRDGRFPAQYDVLMDFAQSERLDVPIERLILLATQRRASLPAEPVASVRSAAVGANDAVWATMETWAAFFHEPLRPLLHQRVETLEAALAWIGKPEALADVRAALTAPQ